MRVLIDKQPLLRRFRESLTDEFAALPEQALETLCIGIRGDRGDDLHVRDMVFGDALFQGHHEALTEQERQFLLMFLKQMVDVILEQIVDRIDTTTFYSVRYIPTPSRLSLLFEVVR